MDRTSNLTGRMDLRASLEELQATTTRRVGAAGTLDELAAVESEAIGRRSKIAEVRRGPGSPAAGKTAGMPVASSTMPMPC